MWEQTGFVAMLGEVIEVVVAMVVAVERIQVLEVEVKTDAGKMVVALEILVLGIAVSAAAAAEIFLGIADRKGRTWR